MKKKLAKRLMCMLLSGMLLASNVEMPLYASEGGEIHEEESSLQEMMTEEAESESKSEPPEAEEPVMTKPQTEEMSVADVEETTEDVISEELPAEEETTQSASCEEEESSSEKESGDSEKEDAFPAYSEFVVNPLYEDRLDFNELISENESLQSAKTTAAQSAAGMETFQNAQQAADYVRSQMVRRSGTIAFYIPTSLITSNNEAFSALTKEIVADATAYTDNCSGQEGDALLWSYQTYQVNSQYDTATQNYLLTYTMTYHTTQEQELELTKKVNDALESLALSEKTEYQKIKSIHDYICDNVNYDYTYSKYSAYDALCTGTAVCEGYAVLYYRMCKDAGLSVRVISGIGNGGAHGWNIVRLGANYYNVDCTWDGQDETTRHTYFLLNEADFVDHTRGDAYATDAFYAQYPMASVSYVDESDFDDPLNQDNPNFSFTTLDGKTVSSAADGKPKLIVFFKVDCYNSQSTLSSIAKDDAFPDVDVYAVEINKNSKDAVLAFQNSYGSENMVFSYDTSAGNGNSLWSYMKAAGLVSGSSFSAALPVICYIDANNQFQYLTQGISNASAIKSNLAHYCNSSVSVETYRITYILNGGTNNSANPATYQSTSGTIILQEPERVGYVFAGWYIDSACTIQITQIDKGNSGDLILYAKWENSTPSGGDKLNLDNLDCSFKTIDEETVISTADKKPKLLVFFSSNCGNSRGTIQQIARRGFPDVDIYAIEVLMSSKETVTSFKNTYGSEDIVFSYDTLYTNSTYLNRYAELAQLDGMAMPIICYIDANNKFQFITQGYSSADVIRSNIDTYCDAAYEKPEDKPSDTPLIDMTPAQGNILMGFSGTYYTETSEKILKRLNEIRLEACKEGVLNPNTSTPLTEADYVPLQWSSDLEAIARLRAAEATVAQSHTRPNGERYYTVRTTNGEQSWAENLAWNYSGLMDGIEQWYDEKSDWVNNTGKTTGHYTSIINPEYNHVAVAAFRLASGGWYAVAQEFSDKSGLDSAKDSTAGACVQDMEVLGSAVTALKFEGTSSPAYVKKGTTMPLSLNATISQKDYYETNQTFTGSVKQGGVWSSSNENAATVDTKGLVTAKEAGEADITVTAGNASATVKIVVYEQEELKEYTVSYDVGGHGTAPADELVKAGAAITPPKAPTADGYVFEGWYRDAACTIPWNFDTDFVQADTILYAKWLIADGTQSDFRIQEIADVSYTGKPCKPAVSVYDGETLLKANKDYKISYHNNTTVNAVKKKGSGVAADFNEALPYVKITGKGNYSNDVLSMNFNILPAAIADGKGNPAKGVKLQYTEQTPVNARKPIAPFRSVKYGKAMKPNEDYQLSLKTIDAFDQAGNPVASGKTLEQEMIPAGYTGSFLLTVTGIGNYTGVLEKNVYVADKAYLLKNAKITLGKQLKSISCKDYTGAFTPAYYDKDAKKYYLVKDGKVTSEEMDAANVYTVSCGNASLIYGQDFDVAYENDGGAGKAQLTIIGKGQYVGRKSVSFQIMGTPLNAGSFIVTLENKIYTGRALTQNEAALIPKDTQDGTPLVYGTDYTISYKKNINKGTATMTFTAVQGSAYSGSFKKTFRIEAADLSDTAQVTQGDAMKDITAEYEKSGAKPSDRIMLTNAQGIRLQNGKDYTVSYINNKQLTKAGDGQSAVMVIKGKGNYTGMLEVPFQVVEGVLDKAQVIIAPVSYNGKKDAGYEYRPSVKIRVQKSTLSAKTDYEVTYEKNTQADYESYLQKLENAAAAEADCPVAVIKAKEGGNYVVADSSKEIRIPLPIYQNKLTKKNLYVVVEDAVYSKIQVTPKVRVYYSENPDAVKAAENLTDEQEIIKSGLVKLNPNVDYTLSYGTNIMAGKNKGSVKISGKAPLYGGDVTVKFTIQSKKITW